MGEVTIIGVDLAKNVFQVHGAAGDGSVLFRKKLSRPQFMRFMAEQRPCRVAMEACASAHHWARQLARSGHEVRLIAPHYVKPFIKRQKERRGRRRGHRRGGAAADHAVRRAEDVRPAGTRHRIPDAGAARETTHRDGERACARISTSSAMSRPRASGSCRAWRKSWRIPDTDMPELARDICRMLLEQFAHLTDRLKALKARIEAMSSEAEMPRRLRTMPGVGPITALAVETFAPPMDHFRRGRDFAAWLGLVPRQAFHRRQAAARKDLEDGAARHPTRGGGGGGGGLLITGAMAVIRWATRRGSPKGSWLARMLERKPLSVVAVALANKMARRQSGRC